MAGFAQGFRLYRWKRDQAAAMISSPNAKENIMRCNTIANTFAIAAAVLVLSMAPGAKAQNRGCSNSIIKGTFAFTASGSVTSPPALAGAIAEIGTQTFDGAGGTTGTATLSSNGNIIPVTWIGTYTVNPDCTGTYTLLISPFGVTVRSSFVVGNNGTEFLAIETEPGFIILRTGRRQFPVGDYRQ